MTKTTRVMLAVLAVCGTSAAMAQSSVNLYGRVNTSVEHQKMGDTKATGLVSNSSYLGFRGVEDLGGGLKAGFQLEGNFGSDDGAGFNFQRHSEVNLSGNFGTLRLGNFDPASYYATADYISMHNHDTGTSSDAFYEGVLWGGNKIAYRTADYSGFNAEVQYQFGEKAGGLLQDDVPASAYEYKGGWDLGLNYANGPLGLGFGYSQAKGDSLVGTAGDFKDRQYAVRASYAIGALTLGAYYQYAKWDEAADNAKRNSYRLAAMYTVGASEFHANVGRADKIKSNGVKQAGTSATQWTLAYNYNLSKRTKVYALYTNIDNGANSDYAPGSRFDSLKNNVDGEDFRSFGIGVRHLF